MLDESGRGLDFHCWTTDRGEPTADNQQHLAVGNNRQDRPLARTDGTYHANTLRWRSPRTIVESTKLPLCGPLLL